MRVSPDFRNASGIPFQKFLQQEKEERTEKSP
jgi:hypothetical protein